MTQPAEQQIGETIYTTANSTLLCVRFVIQRRLPYGYAVYRMLTGECFVHRVQGRHQFITPISEDAAASRCHLRRWYG